MHSQFTVKGWETDNKGRKYLAVSHPTMGLFKHYPVAWLEDWDIEELKELLIASGPQTCEFLEGSECIVC